MDVSDPASVKAGVDAALASYGRIDAVAHCAGVFRNPWLPCTCWMTRSGTRRSGST